MRVGWCCISENFEWGVVWPIFLPLCFVLFYLLPNFAERRDSCRLTPALVFLRSHPYIPLLCSVLLNMKHTEYLPWLLPLPPFYLPRTNPPAQTINSRGNICVTLKRTLWKTITLYSPMAWAMKNTSAYRQPWISMLSYSSPENSISAWSH